MKKKEKTRYHSDLEAGSFMADHDADLTPITLYPPLKTGFDNEMSNLSDAIQTQAIDSGITTADKALIKNILNATIYKFTSRSSVQAHILNLNSLEKSLNVSENYINNLTDDEAITNATKISEILHTNAATLTCLLPADLTKVDTDLKNFKNAQILPKKTIRHKKAEGTDSIATILNNVDVYKKLITKLIHSYLPEYAHDWDEKTKVGKPEGTRHQSITIKFTDADSGVPVINVITTFTKDTLSVTKNSSRFGRTTAYSLEVGTWSATYENNMYIGGSLTNIPVDLKKVARYTIKLQKKTVTDDGSTPATTGYGNGYGTMYNSVSLEPIANGLVFLDKVADPIETDDDGSWGNDHIPADCKTIRGTADGYANYFKNISITPDDDNEIDLPMDPVDDGPTPPDA